MIATQVPRRLSLSETSSTRASLVIPAAHWAETTTVPAVGEVLRRDRQDAMDGPWQTLIGLLGQPANSLDRKIGLVAWSLGSILPEPIDAVGAELGISRTVCMMLRWPMKCCSARVSTPSLASLKPQVWRSMCG